MATCTHERHIRTALELARSAAARGNGPYGALLVRGGEVLLRAENTATTEGDATRHAEMNLLVEAQRRFGAEVLGDCTLYASAEPCAMCAGAIFWAGIGHVVFGCPVERQTEILGGGLRIGCREILASGDRAVPVTGPVLENEAAEVLRVAEPGGRG